MATLFLIIFFTINQSAFAQNHSFADREYDLIGIGISAVDMTVLVTDDEFKRNFSIPYNIKKGALNRINNKTIEAIRPYIKDVIITPGGEVASTLCHFTSLGGTAALDSRIANDQNGLLFLDNLKTKKVSLLSEKRLNEKDDTSVNIHLITPDATKTTLLYIGKSAKISQQDISYNLLKNGKYILLEGSVWNLESKVLKRAINASSKLKIKTVFMLSDVSSIKTFRKQLLDILPEIDLLIGNVNEIKTLFNTDSIDTAIEGIRSYNLTSAITLGDKGAILVNSNGDVIDTPVYNLEEKVIDKSGAGSAFTAGLIYGMIHNKSLEESGLIAAKTAAHAIRQLGRNPVNQLSIPLNQ
ncbi:MAG: adenosine kinase [Alphaproteobacteria bacterium]|nr:adenosine kinase [Candidatus Jidaibacter sp.]